MKDFRKPINQTYCRRIFGLILLFTFTAASVAAQGENLIPRKQNKTGQPVQQDTTRAENESPQATRQEYINAQNESREPAHQDTLRMLSDSTRFVVPDSLEHSPRKAMIYAMVLPGLGQAYNKKYYKIPFVYAIFGGVGYWINYNLEGYRYYVDQYELEKTDLNERYLRLWRRNLELSYITLAASYALQVLDAYVDAYLFYWDVNPDLSLRLEPSTTYAPFMNYGLTLRMNF